MASRNGRKPSGRTAKQTPVAVNELTIDQLRCIFEEGVPVRLLSGTVVQMKPVQLDRLLLAGKVPDILTPLVMRMLFGTKPDDPEFPDEIKDPATHYLTKKRTEAQEAIEFIESVDVICRESLVDAAAIPYLSIADRMWVFKLALMRAEVLSTFRHEPARDVEAVHDEQDNAQPTEPSAVRS